MAPKSRHAYVQPAIVTGWLLTLAQLGYRLATHRLGANPIATALNQLGLLALVLLIASLCATPLKLTLGWTWPLRARRTVGLLAFFTALLHFLLYLGADQGFDLAELPGFDIRRRPAFGLGILELQGQDAGFGCSRQARPAQAGRAGTCNGCCHAMAGPSAGGRAGQAIASLIAGSSASGPAYTTASRRVPRCRRG